MNKFAILIAGAISLTTLPANATHYNQLFDCGNSTTVWVAIGPYGPNNKDRNPKVVFEVAIGDFDFNKGPARSPALSFDPDKLELTADGTLCREMKEDEAKDAMEKFNGEEQ